MDGPFARVGRRALSAVALLGVVAGLLAAAEACRDRGDGEATATPAPATPHAPAKAPIAPGDHTHQLSVDGLAREYVIHVPPGYDGQTPMPVLIMLHGGGGSASGAMRETGWAATADLHGFLAVFPEGTRPDPSKPAAFSGNPQTWNDGSDRNLVGAAQRGAGDIEFLDTMLDELELRYAVDTRRVYVTGFSNGASMTFRVGRELSTRIAAIAPVAGADWLKEPAPSRPVPLLYITGTADPLNPLEGGPVPLLGRPAGAKPPVREEIEAWARMLGCPVPAATSESNGVAEARYGPCRDGVEVLLYTVAGMGHAWPGGLSLLPESIVGKTSNRLAGNEVIWAFFARHTLP